MLPVHDDVLCTQDQLVGDAVACDVHRSAETGNSY